MHKKKAENKPWFREQMYCKQQDKIMHFTKVSNCLLCRVDSDSNGEGEGEYFVNGKS